MNGPYCSIRNITFARILCTHKFTVCFSPVWGATQYLDSNDFDNTKKYFTTISTQFPVFSLSFSSARNIVAYLILHLASLCIHKSPWSVFPVSPNFPCVTAKLPVFPVWIFTTRKRSLGQSNVLRSVFLSREEASV